MGLERDWRMLGGTGACVCELHAPVPTSATVSVLPGEISSWAVAVFPSLSAHET